MNYQKRIVGLILPFMLAACNNNTHEITPEQELVAACPQIGTTETKVVKSDFITPSEGDLKISISGTLNADDSGLMGGTSTLIENATSAKKQNVYITIASGGGETTQGFALRDSVRYYGTDKFYLLCTTGASSAASYIFTTAAKKYALPACEITTHAAKTEISGLDKLPKDDQQRLTRSSKIIENKITGQIRDLYKTSFNLTDKCASFLTRKDDTNLTAYDALKLGFIDAVLEPDGKMRVRETGTKPIPTPS